MKRQLFLLSVICILITAHSAMISAQDTTRNVEYVIMYDEGHKQHFTHDLMDIALSSLNDSLDYSNVDVTVRLVTNSGQFNSSNIQGSDLVLITNPGLDDNNETIDVAESEDDALYNFIQVGGSVLYMNNPYSDDLNITGQGGTMNDLIFSQMDTSVITTDANSPGDIQNSSIILDDFNNIDGDDRFVELTADNIHPAVLREQLNNITAEPPLVYYGSQVEDSTNEGIQSQVDNAVRGLASNYAYSSDRNYEIDSFQENPAWMFGKSFEAEQGRAMLIGSTIMFSNMEYSENMPWIEMGSNKAFFQNIIAWLLKITPQEDIAPVITEGYNFFVRINLLAALLFGFGIFVLSIVYFVKFKNRFKAGELMDIFEKDKSGKSSRDSSSGGDDKPKKKKPRKRERRKRI